MPSLHTGSIYPLRSNGGRLAGRQNVTRAMQAVRRTTASAMAAADRATHDHWRHTWAGPHGAYWSRVSLAEAHSALQEALVATQEALQRVQQLHALYPAEHSDAWSPTRGGVPGQCACGRWAETCPAREALERGEATWEAEDGRQYPVTGGPEVVDL